MPVPEVGRRLQQIARPFTVVILGMGGDGHTASWFPQATNLPDLLDRDSAQVVAATQPVTAPHQRITLTLRAALNSRSLHYPYHRRSQKKRSWKAREEQRYPIAAILEQNTTPATIWWAP